MVVVAVMGWCQGVARGGGEAAGKVSLITDWAGTVIRFVTPGSEEVTAFGAWKG